MSMRSHRCRRHALWLCLGAACTRVTGVAPDDAPGSDATDARADGALACPPRATGHAAGEADTSLMGPIDDPRLADFHLKGAAHDAAGRIYVYGAAYGCSGPRDVTDAMVVRFTADGALDDTFGDDGVACTGREAQDAVPNAAFAFTLDDRGRVVLAGLSYVNLAAFQPNALVARFEADGRPDETFGPNGFRRLPIGLRSEAPWSCAYAVHADADGIVIAGAEHDPFQASSYGFVARLDGEGEFDPTFNRGRAVYETAAWALSSVVRTPAGYAVAGASREVYQPMVVMLGRDGTRVSRFGLGGVATHTRSNLQVRGLELDARGGFVLGGGIVDTRTTGLVRFTPEGAVDTGFGIDGLASAPVQWDPGYRLDPALARRCDGRLLVVGGDGVSGFTLAGLDASGARDGSFGVDGLVRLTPPAGSRPFHSYATLVHPRDGRVTVVTASNNSRGIALWRFWP